MKSKQSLKKKTKGAMQPKLDIAHSGFYPHLRRYLENRLVKGYSAEEDRRIDSHLRQFIVWCDERAIQQPSEVTKRIIERYQKHLYYKRKPNGDTLSIGSQMNSLVCIKAFFKWLTRENYLMYNPASEIELPKTRKRLPRLILSIEQVLEIIEAVDTSTPEGIRDRAMLETLYSTGVRRKELLSLQLHDVDVRRKTLFVFQGKNNKDRMLPLGTRAALWIQKYLNEARHVWLRDIHERHLFITIRGEKFHTSSLSSWMRRRLAKHNIHAGGAHLLRHAMATHMLENGADIRFIQAMLGHSMLSTTEVYTAVSVEKLRQIHEATHPAKVGGKRLVGGSNNQQSDEWLNLLDD